MAAADRLSFPLACCAFPPPPPPPARPSEPNRRPSTPASRESAPPAPRDFSPHTPARLPRPPPPYPPPMSLARTLGRTLPPLAARRTLASLAPRLATATASSSISRRAMSSESIPVPTDFNKVLYTSLAEQDPEVAELIEKETWRQFSGLESVRLAPSALTASPLARAALDELPWRGSRAEADLPDPCADPPLSKNPSFLSSGSSPPRT